MPDLLHFFIEAVLRGLTRLLEAIPTSHLEAMPAAWAWASASCLAIGFALLVAGAWMGTPWFFLSFLALLIAALGLLCLGAFWPRSLRRGPPRRP